MQGILLSVIILIKAKHIANRFLAAFLALLGLGCLLDNHLDLVGDVAHLVLWVGNSFLFAPLLYLYVRHLEPSTKSLSRTLPHLLPFLVVKTIVCYAFFSSSLVEEVWILVGIVFNYLLIAFNFVYLFYSYKHIVFSRKIEVHFKRLIFTFIGVYTAYNVFFLIRRFLDQFSGIDLALFENYLYLGVVFLIYLVSAAIIYYPKLLSLQTKYRKSSMGTDKLAEWGFQIEEYLRSTKPFLKDDFTLETISTNLGLQKHHVSQVMGDYFGMSFYELVNSYRIEEFCQRLAIGEQEKKSILGIAMDCGYKSKSTFNAAFKKLKNVSPSTYLRELSDQK